MATPAIDVAAVKRAVELIRSRRQSDAGDVKNSIADPVAKKLVEWMILRSDDAGVDFSRYAAFISGSTGWPSIVDDAPQGGGAAVPGAPRAFDGDRVLRQQQAAISQG